MKILDIGGIARKSTDKTVAIWARVLAVMLCAVLLLWMMSVDAWAAGDDISVIFESREVVPDSRLGQLVLIRDNHVFMSTRMLEQFGFWLEWDDFLETLTLIHTEGVDGEVIISIQIGSDTFAVTRAGAVTTYQMCSSMSVQERGFSMEGSAICAGNADVILLRQRGKEEGRAKSLEQASST